MSQNVARSRLSLSLYARLEDAPVTRLPLSPGYLRLHEEAVERLEGPDRAASAGDGRSRGLPPRRDDRAARQAPPRRTPAGRPRRRGVLGTRAARWGYRAVAPPGAWPPPRAGGLHERLAPPRASAGFGHGLPPGWGRRLPPPTGLQPPQPPVAAGGDRWVGLDPAVEVESVASLPTRKRYKSKIVHPSMRVDTLTPKTHLGEIWGRNPLPSRGSQERCWSGPVLVGPGSCLQSRIIGESDLGRNGKSAGQRPFPLAGITADLPPFSTVVGT